MCRNIRTLYNFSPPASEEEVNAAALQYVRKISGFSKPSQVNQPAFERAIAQVALASRQLLEELERPPLRRTARSRPLRPGSGPRSGSLPERV